MPNSRKRAITPEDFSLLRTVSNVQLSPGDAAARPRATAPVRARRRERSSPQRWRRTSSCPTLYSAGYRVVLRRISHHARREQT